jgi:hypothetical protein
MSMSGADLAFRLAQKPVPRAGGGAAPLPWLVERHGFIRPAEFRQNQPRDNKQVA